jgi:hypothetical protein
MREKVLGQIGRSFIVCAAALLLVGCGEAPTTVIGLVTLDGKPLAIGEGMRGSVVFQPTVNSGNTLTGVIDRNGHYQLSSGGSLTVTPSVYWVTVSATELIPATDEQPTSGKLVTPAKYASATDSGFRIEIVPGENEVNLPLVSDTETAVAKEAEDATTTPVEKTMLENEATDTAGASRPVKAAAEESSATE